ncbi:hypothetical protein [Flavobacterium sp. RSSB_23]|uniref:hypothetical protein n=1 Tax=Flavobacterium sp. RSSB_23 TaxID=3447668 RepID=UPI003F2BBAD0
MIHLFLTERLRIFIPSLRVARERYARVVPKIDKKKKFRKIMPKIKKLTTLRIEQILTIILYLIIVFFMRNTIVNSYNREVDLNTKKTIIISKKKYDSKLFENFAEENKDAFSIKIDFLLIIMTTFFMMFVNVQRRINKEKEYSLIVGNPKAEV